MVLIVIVKKMITGIIDRVSVIVDHNNDEGGNNSDGNIDDDRYNYNDKNNRYAGD